jgi:uncharacterized membrane protein YcaP (DUF421 family)
MWQLGIPAPELIARTLLVYLILLLALRLFGKREVGQFTLFDLALVLLAANALQPAITGADASIPGALIIVTTIFLANRVVAEARGRSSLVRRLLEPRATVIGRDGAWLADALRREGLDDEDLEAALREHGMSSATEMKLAVLEQDGSISVVPGDGPGLKIRAHHRRYRRRPSD